MTPERVYGLHAVTAALRGGSQRVAGLWVDAHRHDGRLRKLLESAHGEDIPVTRLTRRELDELAGNRGHQGVVAELHGHGSSALAEDLDDLLDGLSTPPFLLVLDGVTDPHNLGACLRSADAAGVHAVVVPKDRAAGITPVVRKVASGAAEHTPFIQVTNLVRSLEALKARGVWVVGADGEAQSSLYDIDFRGPLALVLGAEGAGLRRLTREACDVLVRIPITGHVESLNVSVATGVVLFEACRQRRST